MSKDKAPDSQSNDRISWEDHIQQHPAFEWLIGNRRFLSYFFIAVLFLLVLGYKFASGSAASAIANYQLAEGYLTQIQRTIVDEADLGKQGNAIAELERITNQYPELQSKYDGLIAQLLIVQGSDDDAIPYAERTQARTSSDQDPIFKMFSDTTLLIAEGRHQEALSKTLELKEQLLKSSNAEPSLLLPYLYIRIAMLYQGMGERDLEVLAWDEWLQYTKGEGIKKPAPQALAIISNFFSEGAFTLEQYIAVRKKGSK